MLKSYFRFSTFRNFFPNAVLFPEKEQLLYRPKYTSAETPFEG